MHRLFVFSYHLSPIPCVQRHRLPLLARIEHLVEEFDRFLGAELDRAYARAHETLLHDGDTLLKLRDRLFKRRVWFTFLPFWGKRQKRKRSLPHRESRRRVRYDYEEIFGHDVGGLREALYEFDVFADLHAHQIIELLLVCRFEGCDIRADIEHA